MLEYNNDFSEMADYSPLDMPKRSSFLNQERQSIQKHIIPDYDPFEKPVEVQVKDLKPFEEDLKDSPLRMGKPAVDK